MGKVFYSVCCHKLPTYDLPSDNIGICSNCKEWTVFIETEDIDFLEIEENNARA